MNFVTLQYTLMSITVAKHTRAKKEVSFEE